MMTLRDAIDKDHFYIENISYSDDELKAMSFDGLETLKMQITKKISGLSLSLKEKPDDNFNGGKKRALYINQRVLVYVNSLMRKHRQEARTISDYFMGQAKLFLKENDYKTILINAQREMALIVNCTKMNPGKESKERR
jgi:hypothetical protein